MPCNAVIVSVCGVGSDASVRPHIRCMSGAASAQMGEIGRTGDESDEENERRGTRGEFLRRESPQS